MNLNEIIAKKIKESRSNVKNFKELEIKNYLSEIYENIKPDLVNTKSKNLLVSAMKTGKTTMIFEQLHKDLLKENIQLIFVASMTSLIKSVASKYNVTECYAKKNVTLSNKAVVTTADSLYKVVSACESANKKFFLVVDEAHELESKYLFRNKLKAPFLAYGNKLCINMLCLTATADNIIHSQEWDNVYKIKSKNKFLQASETVIYKDFEMSSKDIAMHLYKTYKANPNNSIIVRLNDKKKIEAVRTYLKTLNVNSFAWYRENENESDNKILDEMIKSNEKEFDIILTTSLCDAGVELYPTRQTIIIDTITRKSNLIDTIQFIGRFRRGIKQHQLLVSKVNTSLDKINYKEAIKQTTARATAIKDLYNNDIQCKSIAEQHDLLNVDFNTETEEYSYSIDVYAVNCMAFNIYMLSIVKSCYTIKEFLEKHFTYNSASILINELDENYFNIEEFEEVEKQIKEANKVDKLLKAEEETALTSYINTLDKNKFEALIKKEEDMDAAEFLLIKNDKEFRDNYNLYHSNAYREFRKNFYYMCKYVSDKQEAFKKSTDKKYFRNFKKQLTVIETNKLYNNSIKLQAIDNADRVLTIKIYAIRNTIKALKDKELKVCLSAKFKKELLDQLQSNNKTLFKKLTEKSLNELLELIYSINKHNNSINNIKDNLNSIEI